ncbi:heme-binding beta-barrel domain-containing protein [Vibrio sp. Sgm 22]|uniref:heme-binding beta-barrel domain-containing protein n=1 Tax=unclassified Vibrio TaxID=2614977 RepID=UPI0022487C22|nr:MULTISPECIES: heme-binding beta-barrel domain-containing protein [unclassified Vibrio]MCX2760779.1 heme-binding beta-barrel domain-containing protein [Vibrio sp. 14G-20]MCX2777464.1 heme-binding beta-barrel domain-containing protein [Vibrio sp. Sgm 22]
MKKLLALGIAAAISVPAVADHNTINGMDFGPLAKLVGTWKSVETGGVDISPGQEGTDVGAGGPAVTPFYEVMTFEVAADATNASDQYLVALYYKQEVFRKADDSKFHDQRGYFIYDQKNQIVYNSYCVPRTTCVTAEGPAGDTMTLVASKRGIAESEYMTDNATTTGFTMNISISDDTLTYSQTTGLEIYDNAFAHTDSSTLVKVN